MSDSDFPDVRLKANVNFPANVIGGAGVGLTYASGSYTINLAFGEFIPPTGVTDAAHQCALLYNTLTGFYSLVPVSSIVNVGGVPEAPNDGQQYGRQSLNWTVVTPSASPSGTNPVMDGVAAPGVAAAYARGDHVHPSDTSRLPVANPTFTGTITGGVYNTTAKNNQFGTAGGTLATGAVTPADANVKMYDFGGGNWAGIGTDNNGWMWFRTGLSGTPAPAYYITSSQVVAYVNPPTAPTLAVNTNTTQLATTAYVLGQASSLNPLANGAVTPGISTLYARTDHVHPTDTTLQPIDADLTAVAALSGTGIVRRTSTTPTWSTGTAVANGELATMAAYTFKGNNSGSSATPGDVDISALTTKASPGGTDYLLLSDQAASGAWKKIAISTLPGASGGISDAPNDGQLYGRQSLGWTVIPGVITPAALTKTDDTNVTLTLGGTPATALLQATSITVGWSGTLALARGGTAANLAATGGAGQYLKQTSSGGAVSVGTIPASDIASGAALTKTDDANVTLTLGGTPASALLVATSITVGWSGTLSAARGGFGTSVSASSGVPIFTTGVPTFTATTGSGSVVLATSPALTGSPTAPTQAANDNSTKVATTAYTDGAVSTAQALDMKLAGNQTTTGGFNVTPFNAGTFSTGTFTPSALNHNYQYYLNNGAHTLAAPTIDSAMDILVQNSTAPGAITFSGFRVGAATGDPYATAARASIAATFSNGSSTITVTAHGLVAGDPVYFTTTGTLPTNFSPSTLYRCVSVLSSSTFTVAATVGGTAIVAGSAGSGTHTMVAPSQFVISIRRVNGVSTYLIKALQ